MGEHQHTDKNDLKRRRLGFARFIENNGLICQAEQQQNCSQVQKCGKCVYNWSEKQMFKTNLLAALKDNYKAATILDSGQLELNSPIVQQPERTEIMPRHWKWVENA